MKMKESNMAILVIVYKMNLKLIYFIMKMFPIHKNKIVLLSRQSNKPSLDFLLLEKALYSKHPHIEIVVLTKKLDQSFAGGIIYYFHTLRQLYHIATAKVCILDSYIIPISILKHKKELKVIQLWHAMGAIKKFGYQTLDKEYGRKVKLSLLMNMHQNYDIIISGSEKMIPFFSEAFHVPKEKFRSYGLPKIDYIIQNEKLIKQKLFKKYPDLKNKKVILYVPTFRVNKNNNLYRLCEYIDYSQYIFIMKQHPNDSNLITDDRVTYFQNVSSLELLTAADIVITDYSAISIEAAALNKKIYFYVYDYEDYVAKNGLNIDLYSEFPGCVYGNPRDLIDAIEQNQYDISLVNNFRNKYVSDDGYSIEKITSLILKFILENKQEGKYEEI
jgi:CDP-ribitol ribitolphosphotransferase